MKMSSALEQAFNAQVTLEMQASIVYRQLAIELDNMDLPGMASWLREQAEEEVVHANKFIDHMLDRDNHPRIGAIAAPTVDVETVHDAFTAAYQHEQKVSEAIRTLYRTAEQEGDLDSRPLLDWFLTEQIEEEATVSTILSHLEIIKDDGPGLLRLDNELGQRPTQSA
ncbi:ferritin [Microbacterium sp.]|uniref:ferritin n=1 Tax=Microbacterium sp. TaxID=51671 RepID=UPI003A88BD8B